MNKENLGRTFGGKEQSEVDSAKLRRMRMRSLNKGKARSLRFFEKMSMKYAGFVDGKKGLLSCNENGIWQSSTLKQEVDSYEEFCAELLGGLKLEEEEAFKELNILFDRIVLLRKKRLEEKAHFQAERAKEPDLTKRREGEEHLSELQVAARREREKEQALKPLREKVETCEKELSETIETIFAQLSRIKENLDSTAKIMNRVLQHCQRRVDVYWHSALCFMANLPAVPDVTFTNVSEEECFRHYCEAESRAENLRRELESELCEEAV